MKISIVGSGYVGLCAGVGLRLLGHDVTLIDIDKEKVERINKGELPIYDQSLEEVSNEPIKGLRASTEYSDILDTDITIISVGTPSNADGSVDLSYIKSAAFRIGKELAEKDKHIVVVKSTVPPGTTENIVGNILESNSKKKIGEDIGLAMNPEFLQEGSAIKNFINPDRIVIGTRQKWVAKILLDMYSKIKCPKIVVDPTTAEMIKYASNAFLATKISFANEIGNICKKVGIDAYEVFRGVGLDHRISPSFFGAGLGFGGSCFPKDVEGLIRFAEYNRISPSILKSVIEVNENQPKVFVSLLKKYLDKTQEKTVGILGLAFKPGTDDIRESRGIEVIRLLLQDGYNVIAYDPMTMENVEKLGLDMTLARSAEELLDKARIIGITTDWPLFRKLDYTGKIVVDGRNVREAKKSAEVYEGMCW